MALFEGAGGSSFDALTQNAPLSMGQKLASAFKDPSLIRNLGGMVGNAFNQGSASSRPNRIQETRFTPQQSQLMDALNEMAQNQLGNTNLDFGPYKEQAMRRFNNQTVPSLLSQLSNGLGPDNDFGPTQYAQILGAGKDLESDLAVKEQMFNQQNLQNLFRLLPHLLKPQFDYRNELPEEETDQGGFGSILQALAPVGGAVAGGAFGGPAGAAIGSQAGQTLGQLLGQFFASSKKPRL